MRCRAALLLLPGAAAIGDLQRTKAKVPRDDYRHPFFYHMGKTLNGHLARAHPNTVPCHKWSSADLQKLQATLLSHREEEHDRIYKANDDPRALRHATAEEHVAHWATVTRSAGAHPLIKEMQRDGHCHEAVMWWVHHLSHETRQRLRHLAVPTVPLVEWRQPTAEEGAAAAQVFNTHYHPSSTCQACHGGGIPWQIDDVEASPLPRQVNGNDRRRRCDEWYGPEQGGECGPCDGIGGWYYGDMPDEGTFPDCEVVSTNISEEERAPRTYPKAFAVEMRGADRWPRASPSSNASCNYVSDCSPVNTKYPGSPVQGQHWYATLHGCLYVDHNLGGQFSGGRLRHESAYEFPNGKEGVLRAQRGQFGEWNVHQTEIHVQSREWAEADDAGVMLNSVHASMNAANKSGTDDSQLDWRRIPATDGMCVCLEDPAGMPNFMGAFSNATYRGRVKLNNLLQRTSFGGPPDGKPVIADTWQKWTFHLYVDVSTGFPMMFTSPYGGSATYGNWTVPDPEILWPEWRENPPSCVNVKNHPNCDKMYPPPSHA